MTSLQQHFSRRVDNHLEDSFYAWGPELPGEFVKKFELA